jgi:hypothetical protein
MAEREVNGGGKATTIDQEALIATTAKPFLNRVTIAIRTILGNTWMSPVQPLNPVAPETAGRMRDYPVGENVRITPRQGEGVTFDQLYNLANNYDLLRTVIETRKDQLVKIQWSIKPIDDKQKTAGDERIAQMQKLLRMPDGKHSWQTWLRMLLEEMLVTDAPTIYPRFNFGGELIKLDLITGATIVPRIGADGRQPEPPDVAYQQVLKGIPTSDFNADQLIYVPRNPRVNKLYGFSPVEQIIMSVNIAIRRQVYQLQYYTEGSTPDVMLSVPATWTPKQIAEFEDNWNAMLAGDTANRRRTKFIPDGSKPYDTKEAVLKDEMDEWLARIVCYAFSVSPQAFVKQMNRATADTAQETSLQEGLVPLMQWVKDVIDLIIWKYFGWDDLEFNWDDEDELDPAEQAKIDDTNIKNGSKSIDEVRTDRGDEPIGFPNAVYVPAVGFVLLEDVLNPPEPVQPVVDPNNPQGGQNGQPTPPGNNAQNVAAGQNKDNTDLSVENQNVKFSRGRYLGKVMKAKVARQRLLAKVKKQKDIVPIDHNRPKIEKLRTKMTNRWAKLLSAQSSVLADQISAAMTKMAKAEDPNDDPDAQLDAILGDLDMSGFAEGVNISETLIQQASLDGAYEALIQVGIEAGETDAATKSMVKQISDLAVEYAKSRSAEMVGMMVNEDGDVVPNDDAAWSISDSTRNMMRGTISEAIEQGWSHDQLKDALSESYAFSKGRADTIARTEINKAEVKGNMNGYKASGVVKGKQWILGDGHDIDDPCDDNADAGTIGLDEDFPSGDSEPPQHPNCICSILPVVIDGDEDEDD